MRITICQNCGSKAFAWENKQTEEAFIECFRKCNKVILKAKTLKKVIEDWNKLNKI